ncbi:transporter substrate-binding domain-containing protein [Aminobacter sp. MSH1]|uniref:transporter substrate-binding domain-containing protein n=1 Tax=Aminobacter sp. MSH1 TaxID=374606 RepID=UPI00131F31D8|nr:transporter substrate-binding domain-containing protein [Aminobacter sp. MSH1]
MDIVGDPATAAGADQWRNGAANPVTSPSGSELHDFKRRQELKTKSLYTTLALTVPFALTTTAVLAQSAPVIPQKYLDEGVKASTLCATGAHTYCEPNSNVGKGILPDINAAWAKEVGLELTVEGMSWDAVMPSAISGRTDIVAGLGDLESRREQFNFVDVFVGLFSIIVPAGNPASISSWADLCGKKVSAPHGSGEQEGIEHASEEHCVSQGKPAIVLDLYADQPPAFLAVQSGRSDASVTNNFGGKVLVEDNPTVYAEGFKSPSTTVWAVAVPVGNPELLEVVKYGVQKAIANGVIKAILEEHQMGDAAMTQLMVNRQVVE